MIYGYPKISDAEVIKNYKIEDDKIIINYLNNESDPIPYALENENKLIARMMKQAVDRDNSNAYSSAQKKIISEVFLFIIITVLSLMYISAGKEKVNAGHGITLIVSPCILDLLFRAIKKEKNEIKDLKKYRIYLEIMDKLKLKIEEDPDFLNTVFSKPIEEININTLDNHSLGEIKKLSHIFKN